MRGWGKTLPADLFCVREIIARKREGRGGGKGVCSLEQCPYLSNLKMRGNKEVPDKGEPNMDGALDHSIHSQERKILF